jgi:hypothetical protein
VLLLRFRSGTCIINWFAREVSSGGPNHDNTAFVFDRVVRRAAIVAEMECRVRSGRASRDRDFRGLARRTEHPATVLAEPRIELGTERESRLQVLDKDAYFGGQPPASSSNREDRHDSFEGSQKR